MPLPSNFKIPKWAWALFTITSSIFGAAWTVRGMVDEHDKRITVLEQAVPEIRDNVRDLVRVLIHKP